LVGIEHSEHIGLVLRRIDRPMQFATIRTLHDLRVVTGPDRIEAQRHRLVQQRGELDPLVAAQAGVGGAARGILGDEVLDHLGTEARRQVPDVERDAQPIGDAARVGRVLQRAAASGLLAHRPGVLGQRQVHPDNLVPGVDQPRGGDRRVHPAAHRRDDAHQATPAARRARSRAAGNAARTASTSAPVEVCPKVKRRAPRASRSLNPMANKTWLGCGTPAWQADPVEHSTPAASSR